ncbi:hypothetical protein C1Y40_05678 [Mycobacterium talmoniae]|uniref:Uncharacterized protein n=1 Tax=Mycobacterium talmoniae TaxID=1858794 RepID=A0A2S8BBY4_9MYCO|nr:hypothetical protein C1Y40_05678 [Mycobacterium talmoniae]
MAALAEHGVDMIDTTPSMFAQLRAFGLLAEVPLAVLAWVGKRSARRCGRRSAPNAPAPAWPRTTATAPPRPRWRRWSPTSPPTTNRRSGGRPPTPAATCWTPRCARCRPACPASCIWPVRSSPAAIWAGPARPAADSSPTRSSRGSGCTAPATWCAAPATARCTTWAAPTARSRSAATGSNPTKSPPRCSRIRRWPRPGCWSATTAAAPG